MRGPAPPTAPEPAEAPEPDVAPSPTMVRPMDYLASPRYTYLSGRLRSRQITMEEATELFAIFQNAIASLPPSPIGPPGGPAVAARVRRPRSEGRREAGPVALSDEDLGLALVAFGAGAGLLAAILKRSAEGPKAAGPK